MKSIVKNDLKGTSLELISTDIPKLKPGFVLVKIHASPINPSDLTFIHGAFGDPSLQPKPPVSIGFEGSGTVIAIGENVSPDLQGKNVCFFINCHTLDFTGTWSTHTIIPAASAIVVPDGVDMDTAAMSQINPLTVIGFWEIIKRESHKALIQTAAASAAGKMLIKLCKEKGIETINVVRSDASAEMLKKMGVKFVLNSKAPEFEKELEKIVSEVKPTIFFDAVGGELTEKIFYVMPSNSIMYIYGSLETPDIKFKGTDIRYMQKTIKGYAMLMLMKSLSEEEKKGYIDFIWNDLKTDGKIFKTEVAAKYDLKDFKEALSEYPKLASQGKVLFTPH